MPPPADGLVSCGLKRLYPDASIAWFSTVWSALGDQDIDGGDGSDESWSFHPDL
jgi:hypothetical protein